MNILNSEWFLRMLNKTGASPSGRLLAVFDILGDWVDAPQVGPQLDNVALDSTQSQALIEYLTTQARAAGAQQPELLAQQLYLMAQSMLQQELRSPASVTSRNARLAAQALIQAQTQKEHFIGKRSAYAVAASACLCTMLGGSLLMMNVGAPAAKLVPVSVVQVKPRQQPSELLVANPRQTAAMFASLEQMRGGTCQYPEALMLPESQKSIYIDSVVGGQVPTMTRDQQVFDELLKKVRCNYTPMLMANSLG